jgi:hypothetical protein
MAAGKTNFAWICCKCDECASIVYEIDTSKVEGRRRTLLQPAAKVTRLRYSSCVVGKDPRDCSFVRTKPFWRIGSKRDTLLLRMDNGLHCIPTKNNPSFSERLPNVIIFELTRFLLLIETMH